MFISKRYSQSINEFLNKDNKLCENRERAYKYYSRKFKNDYPPKYVKGKELYLYTNTLYELKKSEYIYYDFDTIDIGKTVALNESDFLLVEGVRFNYCNFTNCNIKNIIFKQCSFSGSSFDNVHFERVIFDSCMFSIPVMEDGKIAVDDIYYAPTLFKICTIVGRFSDCDIDHTLFEKVCFTCTKFERCMLQDSLFYMCALSSIDIRDCNLCSFSICHTDILELSFSDVQKSIVNENTFIDYRIQAKKEKGKAEVATTSGWKTNDYYDMCLKKAKSLKAISRIFDLNNLSDFSGEYFYYTKLAERKAINKFPKLISTLELALCGYGERPLFTMITIILTTIIFGLIYMFTGINADGYFVDYSIIGGNPVGFVKAISDYGKCLFFSVTTFSTVGYGNYVPIGALSMLISGLQMIVGVSLCALWTGCIFRKIAR